MSVAFPGPITGLAHLVVGSQDLDGWSRLAAEVLGMQVTPLEAKPSEAKPSEGRALRLRMDDRVGRILIEEGPRPGVTAVGWEVTNRARLDELAARLETAGTAIDWLDEEAAARRGTSVAFAFLDPAGLRVEVGFGAYLDPIDRFVSPLGVRFVTGEQGLGHITVLTDRYEEQVAFYCDLLGFTVRETVAAEFEIAFLGCNRRQHAIAVARGPGLVGTHFDHLMIEVDDIDDMGRALDKVLGGAAPLSAMIGRHWNDEMISFYLRTPDGFRLEYGFGGKQITSDDEVELTQRTPGGGSTWGHKMMEVPGT